MLHPTRLLIGFCLLLILGFEGHAQTPALDPYRWLEDVNSDAALTWVRERNALTQAALQPLPTFEDNRRKLLAVYSNRQQIAAIQRWGKYVYNHWRDAQNPRGLWRRTSLDEYRQAQPQWELLLDLDALGKAENENWVWGSADCLGPLYERCLVQLSRGGADAKVVREFDLGKRMFLSEGFTLPEAKTEVQWADLNTLYVGTDFGAGSLTASGYPRLIKRWKRATPLSEASKVFEGQSSDVAVSVQVDRTPGFERSSFTRHIDFFNDEVSLLLPDGSLRVFPKPADAQLSWHRAQAFLLLKSDYTVGTTTYVKGSLLGLSFPKGLEPKLDLLFSPTPTRALGRTGPVFTRDGVLWVVQDLVASRLEEAQRAADGRWHIRPVKTPTPGTLKVTSLYDPQAPDDALANSYLLSYADFLTPQSLYLAQTGNDQRELLKRGPQFFQARGLRVAQHFATSADGTRVPYFVVYPKGYKPKRQTPTLLYGYGGFQLSLEPWYSGNFGNTWYSRGGVLVVANIRGGGEFGPAWHQAAVKQHKQKSYDDFIAVAQDLIQRGVTTPKHLGLMGGSNGGLLVGAVMLQRPELFAAVVSAVPLLDMQRYHLLLAGHSWMAEYGDPDKAEDWAVISRYSPYQNVKAGVKYPKVLLTTSTRDDRVHPGHARKMAARMLEQGHEVLYYENVEGGHGGAADHSQRAYLNALEMSFLWSRLGGK